MSQTDAPTALPFSFKMDWPNLMFRCNHCPYVCSFFTTDLGEALPALQQHHDGAHGLPSVPAAQPDIETQERYLSALRAAARVNREDARAELAETVPVAQSATRKPQGARGFSPEVNAACRVAELGKESRRQGGSPAQAGGEPPS